MAERGECFCMLLQEWAAHVYNRNIALMQQPPWKSIHGYPILLKAFLLSMKSTPVEKMSAQIFWCASSLLKNPSLIKVFTQVILAKTNLHNTVAVMTALDEVGDWMTMLEHATNTNTGESPFSTSFDWALLVKALSLALSSDHFAVLSATIAFIFNHIQHWPPFPQSVVAREVLFNRFFLKLFGHWEAQVRRAYMRLIVFRFLRISSGSSSWSNLGQDINKLYRDGICTMDAQFKSQNRRRPSGVSPLNKSVGTIHSTPFTGVTGKSFSADSLCTLEQQFGSRPFTSGFPRRAKAGLSRTKTRSLSVENLCELEEEMMAKQSESQEHFEVDLIDSDNEEDAPWAKDSKLVFPDSQKVYIGFALHELKEILLQARKLSVNDEAVPTMRFKRQESKMYQDNDATLVLEGTEEEQGTTRNQDVNVEGPLVLGEQAYSEW